MRVIVMKNELEKKETQLIENGYKTGYRDGLKEGIKRGLSMSVDLNSEISELLEIPEDV
jgi:flagellar biosynthesis/type III secretory pathway protein FliH